MDDEEIAKIAEKVSTFMQLDRMRHQVDTQVDMTVLGAVPAYIASVFEQANEINSDLEPHDVYRQINKRISQVQAQLYLIRLEMENRSERDPASIFEDPMVIAAYGERIVSSMSFDRSFSFETSILAYGWYPVEVVEGTSHRWMRPADVSVACVPHLGPVDQIIEVSGRVLVPEQLPSLSIRAGNQNFLIQQSGASPVDFKASLSISKEVAKHSNHLPIEFRMRDFREPASEDTRMLGANVSGFSVKKALEEEARQDP
ncbi:hypothetical protein SAMN05421688_2472 [Poseidonocella pacifica]|uniref:Uncharacterized protein n=2 Tax=Poseidonocella pacifica TaxID=871651 RepID=A0A1I0XVG0_9RHOB|nr:hypothetical protein SAMN05421688_2472 [Poseidonocella pacifica]